MTKEEDLEYQKNSKFWTEKGDNLTVIGDYLGRLPALELIDVQKMEYILDAGCGAGFMSRRMAREGAIVCGCDRNENMLEGAKAEEKKMPLGIEYKLSDITSLPYENDTFDKIACIAVLIHDSPRECTQFFQEAHRTLKPEGKLIVSIMHPHLYQFGSANRRGLASWAKYTNLEAKSMDVSQRFKEEYRNSNGEIFSSTVWYHPESFLLETLKKTGFTIKKVQSTYITKKVLEACNQTGPEGYPCFWQVLAEEAK